MFKLKEINRRKLFWTDSITSISLDKWSPNDTQVRLTKPRLRIVLFFIISVWAEKFSFYSKIMPLKLANNSIFKLEIK